MAAKETPEQRRAIESAHVRRVLTSKRNQQAGVVAQNHAAEAMRQASFWMVEGIATHTRMIRGRRMFTSSVSGDLRAIVFGGRSVLCEVKDRPDVLVYSDLKPHQIAALELHDRCGGASLVAWVREGRVALMQFPIEGFESGTSIDWQRACSLVIRTVRDLRPTLVKPAANGIDSTANLPEVPHGAH